MHPVINFFQVIFVNLIMIITIAMVSLASSSSLVSCSLEQYLITNICRSSEGFAHITLLPHPAAVLLLSDHHHRPSGGTTVSQDQSKSQKASPI